MQTLSKAVQLAEPEEYQRLFLEDGELLLPLLAEIESGGTTAIYRQALLTALKEQLPTPDEQAHAPISNPAINLLEPLTEREEQTLRLMAAGLTNREIAAELYLSHNTIKAYTSRIYGKLGVSSRAEAINRAYQLNLL